MNLKACSRQLLCGLLIAAIALSGCASQRSIAGFLPFPSDTPTVASPDDALAAELTALIGRDDSGYDPHMDEPPLLRQPAMAAMIKPMSAVTNIDLTIPASFAVAKPDEELKTSYASYFITGTSDPAQPVYFQDEEIERLGAMGTFGVHVDLEMGRNAFTLRQGDRTQTVVIERTPPAGTAQISDIRQDSMVPSVSAGVVSGKNLSVGCIAPAGAAVTATFAGSTVRLVQSNSETKTGYPAAYTGKIAVSGQGIAADVTELAGRVDYTLTYNGETKRYTSSGDVYVAGADTRIVVEVTNYLGFIYHNYDDPSQFKETVKAGARDTIEGQSDEHYKLSSGGFIPKSQVAVVTGKGRAANQISQATYALTGRTESVTFHGTRLPMYDTWTGDNALYIRLYNTSGAPVPAIGGSGLISSCSTSVGENHVTYQFPLKAQPWGYDVAFQGNDTVLTLRRKPALADDADRPLTGVTVVVDPGHGGTDPGALGTAGKLGPTEADVNLANALATGERLAQLGASVVMTRTDDQYLSLDDRMKLIEESRADIFVSLHHNSVAESTDANKVDGIEVYYHTGLSRSFGDTMMNSLSQGLGRKNRKVEQSYYRVTLMHYSPALLLELGFMANPLEYEKSATSAEIQRVADAVSDGIVQSLR